VQRWFEAKAARACAGATISWNGRGAPGTRPLRLRDFSRADVDEPPGRPWVEGVERAPAEDKRGAHAADPAERRPPAGQAVHHVGPPARADDVPRIRADLYDPFPSANRPERRRAIRAGGQQERLDEPVQVRVVIRC